MNAKKVISFCLNAPLSLLASGAIIQFVLTLFNLNLHRYLVITLQSLILILFYLHLNKRYIEISKPKFNFNFSLNVIAFSLFMLSIYHLLSFHSYFVTDLINTANLLNNVNGNRIYSGLVDPYIYIDKYRYSEDSAGVINLSNDVFNMGNVLFYPSGSLFSISFMQFFTSFFFVLNLVDIQIVFMFLVIAYLYFYIYIYLNNLTSKYATYIFTSLLIFNFFPSYLIVAGDLALLSSYVYAILITLFHLDKSSHLIFLSLNIIIIVFLHPLGLYAFFLGLLVKRRLSYV